MIAERFIGPAPAKTTAIADIAAVRQRESNEEAGARPPVRHLVVDGRLVIEDDTLLTGDIDEIRHEAAIQAPHLWSRMAEF